MKKIEAILKANRDTSKQLVFPKKVKNNIYEWQNAKTFGIDIDFETVPQMLLDSDVTTKQKTPGDFIKVGKVYRCRPCRDRYIDHSKNCLKDGSCDCEYTRMKKASKS